MCRIACILLSLRIAQRHFGLAWARTSSRDESLDQITPRLGHDQAIPFSGGEAGRSCAAGGDHDRRLDVMPIK